LKKQGMLGLTFANKEDYNKVQEDDSIDIVDLVSFAPEKPLTLVLNHADGSKDIIKVNHTYNANQIEWFKAGSALNLMGAKFRDEAKLSTQKSNRPAALKRKAVQVNQPKKIITKGKAEKSVTKKSMKKTAVTKAAAKSVAKPDVKKNGTGKKKVIAKKNAIKKAAKSSAKVGKKVAKAVKKFVARVTNRLAKKKKR
jgi:aconitate hydratase